MLTSDHVVRDCREEIRVRYPNQDWHRASVSGRDETNDLALLRSDLEGLEVASFRQRSQIGEPVAAYGFPYAGLLSSSGNFTTGTLAALTGMNDDSRFLQTSTPVQPGNSGGPLLDMSASVIGVVEGQLNALTMMRFADSVPQNVNFAVQAPIAVNFLLAKGQTPKIDNSITHSELATAEVAERAQRFTVQVYCGGVDADAPAQTSGPSTPERRQASPAPSNETAVEVRAREFAISIQRLWSGPNADVLPAMGELYQDEVNYYGKQMTRAEIIKEKRAFMQKFPQREYRPREPILVSCREDACLVHGDVDFKAIDPVARIISSGVASFYYELALVGMQLRIKVENGHVISRSRQPL